MIRFSDQWRTLTLTGPRDSWYWEPKPDMTTQELAMCLIPFLAEDAALVATLPPPAQRHFRRELNYGMPDRMNAVAPDAQMERNAELTAVTGAPLEAEWTRIAVVLWPGMEDREMGLCWRRKEA